jgi:hypothetical protein
MIQIQHLLDSRKDPKLGTKGNNILMLDRCRRKLAGGGPTLVPRMPCVPIRFDKPPVYLPDVLAHEDSLGTGNWL